MSMTKAEKAVLEGLRHRVSMRWPDYAMPRPMTREDIEAAPKVKVLTHDGSLRHGPEDVAEGWYFNSYGARVTKGYSTTIKHCSNAQYSVSWSRDMGVMYRTELEALMAMRLEITAEVAKRLAAVDALIEAKVAEIAAEPAAEAATIKETRK